MTTGWFGSGLVSDPEEEENVPQGCPFLDTYSYADDETDPTIDHEAVILNPAFANTTTDPLVLG